MKLCRKIIGFALTGLMLVSSFPAVYAQDYKQPEVIDYFTDFSGWQKNENEGELPEIFKSINGKSSDYNKVSSETKDNNTYMKILANTQICIPFDEVVSTGKLRISFDAKLNNLCGLLRFSQIDNSVNDNAKDWGQSEDLTIVNNNLFFDIFSDRTESDAGKNTKYVKYLNKWARYTLEWTFAKTDIDASSANAKITLNINGETIVEIPNRAKPKAFGLSYYSMLKDYSYGAAEPMYLDNLCVEHYPDGTYKGLKMSAEYNSTGVDLNNGVVKVGFSDLLKISSSEEDPIPDDFKVINVNNNTEYTPTDITKDSDNPNMLNIKLPEISQGRYEIKYAAGEDGLNVYSGVYTHQAITGSAFFNTKSSSNANGELPYYYVNDNYDNYITGMPANATGYGLNERTGAGLKSIDHNTGKAVEISNGKTVMYNFDDDVTSDKLVYEFDIKHNGKWGLNILKAIDTNYEVGDIHLKYAATGAVDTIRDCKPGITPEKVLELQLGNYFDRRKASVALGNGGSNDNSVAFVYKDKQNNIDVSDDGNAKIISGVSVNKDEWTHIKVEMDLLNGKYNLTVGEGEGAQTATADYRTLAPKLFNGSTSYRYRKDDGKWERYLDYGIGGIGISSLGNDSVVAIDNFKVYTPTSYNGYSDFNTFNTNDDAYAGLYNWYDVNWPGTSLHLNNMVPETRTGNDKSLKFKNLQANKQIAYKLAHPIKAGTNFSVEYDVKTNANEKFAMSLLEESDLYINPKSSYATSMPWSTIYSTEKDSDGNYIDAFYAGYNQLASNDYSGRANYLKNNGEGTKNWNTNYNMNYTLSNGYKSKTDTSLDTTNLYFYKGSETSSFASSAISADTAAKSGENNVKFEPGKWNHIKFSVKYENGKIYYKVANTPEGGATVESDWFEQNRALTEDTYAIAFNATKDSYSMQLDNLKVYEDTASTGLYVTYANEIDANAKAKTLSNTLSNYNKIEIGFSSAIKSADNVSVYNAVTGSESGIIKTLSADGKSMTIEFETAPNAGDIYTIAFGGYAAANASSYLVKAERYGASFTVNQGELGTTNDNVLRLYKYYESRTQGDKTYPGGWYPVSTTNIYAPKTGEKYCFGVQGVNGGDVSSAAIVSANRQDNVLLNCGLSVKDLTRGNFTAFGDEITFSDGQTVLDGYAFDNMTNIIPITDKVSFKVIPQNE